MPIRSAGWKDDKSFSGSVSAPTQDDAIHTVFAKRSVLRIVCRRAGAMGRTRGRILLMIWNRRVRRFELVAAVVRL